MQPPSGGLDLVRTRARRRLRIATVITFTIFIAEVAGGLISNSLALLSDAGHMLGDLVALGITLLSIYWATKPATSHKTYGYYRLEILASLINGLLMVFIALQILWSAGQRILEPQAVQLLIMLPVASIGLVANVISIFLLHRETDHLATRSAFFHVVGDTLSSVGVVLIGTLIYFTSWIWLDPAISLAIAIAVLVAAYRILREAVDILLEASPSHIELGKVEASIRGVQGVEDVHDLHVWTISSGFYAASAHLLVHNMRTKESDEIIQKVSLQLRKDFSITHVTLQIGALPQPAQIQVLS